MSHHVDEKVCRVRFENISCCVIVFFFIIILMLLLIESTPYPGNATMPYSFKKFTEERGRVVGGIDIPTTFFYPGPFCHDYRD